VTEVWVLVFTKLAATVMRRVLASGTVTGATKVDVLPSIVASLGVPKGALALKVPAVRQNETHLVASAELRLQGVAEVPSSVPTAVLVKIATLPAPEF
jgi:hypothetical protein